MRAFFECAAPISCVCSWNVWNRMRTAIEKHKECSPDASRPKPLMIGNVVVDPPLIVAPMAGVTDAPFRRVMLKHGAGMATTEMISTEGIRRSQPATWSMCEIDRDLREPVAVQLFGRDPVAMAEAARMLEQRGAPLLDVNAGCPVKKVVRQGAGAALLRKPELLAALVEAIKKAVSIPVTVKIRLGWDSRSIQVIDVVKRLESAGADAVTIHARTAAQHYTGRADWKWLRRVKAEARIPIIGNGDVFSPCLADRMLRETGCDGVMVGRASMGNPWFIGALASRWGGGGSAPVDTGWEGYLDAALAHADAFLERKPACIGHFRMVLVWYSKGCPDAGRFRSFVMRMNRPDEIRAFFREWVEGVAAKGVPFLTAKVVEGAGSDRCSILEDGCGWDGGVAVG